MLGGKISNQDEDEVEDELDALEAELTGALPDVPIAELPVKERARERAKARKKQREEARQAVLA